MLFDPMRNICMTSTIQLNFNPHVELLSSLAMNGSLITPQKAKEVYRLRQYMGPMSFAERNTLIPAMQKLCQGIPIMRVRNVDVNQEEFEAGRIDIFNGTVFSSRRKRFAIVTCQTQDKCTLDPLLGGRYCRWYTCGSRDVGGRCNLEHIRDGSWQCVVCCPGRRDRRMCNCNEIQDERSFVQCQNRNFG